MTEIHKTGFDSLKLSVIYTKKAGFGIILIKLSAYVRSAPQTWGKLTEDDFKIIQGNHQEIYGKLQKHYGYTRDKIKQEIENFQNKL